MTRIVIAGCGDVGTALGLRLTAAGHEVWGLKRNSATLPPAIRPLAADLTRPDTLGSLPPDIGALVYIAAAGGYREDAYRAAYVDGVGNLLAVLREHGEQPRRVLLVSSTSVYDQHDGEWVDEDSPAEAPGFASEALRAGERLVWDSPYPATVVRFAGIYGPGREQLIRRVQAPDARCEAGLYTNRIHRDDCAGALAHLLALDDPAPLYLGVDDEPALQCEVMRWLAAHLGVPEPTAVDAASAERLRPRSNKRLSNARLRASGWRSRYPGFREGYAALLADSD